MKYFENLRNRPRTRLSDLFAELLSINKCFDPIFQNTILLVAFLSFQPLPLLYLSFCVDFSATRWKIGYFPTPFFLLNCMCAAVRIYFIYIYIKTLEYKYVRSRFVPACTGFFFHINVIASIFSFLFQLRGVNSVTKTVHRLRQSDKRKIRPHCECVYCVHVLWFM